MTQPKKDWQEIWCKQPCCKCEFSKPNRERRMVFRIEQVQGTTGVGRYYCLPCANKFLGRLSAVKIQKLLVKVDNEIARMKSDIQHRSDRIAEMLLLIKDL